MTPFPRKSGRKPANPAEGAARNYTIRLTDAQARRALALGATVNAGVNAALRELVPVAPEQEKTMYYVNVENTGLDTDDQAREVARILAAQGFNVEFTRNFGMVNDADSCPCSDEQWFSAVEQAGKI